MSDVKLSETAKKILKKVHEAAGDEGVGELLSTKELPPIKLSAEEMAFIKGGGFWSEMKRAGECLDSGYRSGAAEHFKQAGRELKKYWGF